MNVKIQIEFEVKSDELLTEKEAKAAASIAAYDFLSFSKNGLDSVDRVFVDVDGFGECMVEIGGDHE